MSAFLSDLAGGCGSTNVVPPSTVNVLVPTKPIKEYVEFESCYKHAEGPPDYKFQIDNVKTLIQHKGHELRGKEFQVPGHEFTAQIECRVNYDHFHLYIRFLRPSDNGKAVEMRANPIITTSIVNNSVGYPKSPDQKLTELWPYDTQLSYGTFCLFLTLYYDGNFKRAMTYNSNSITLHLHVRDGVFKEMLLENGSFCWKVDVSHCNLCIGAEYAKEKQVALSPSLFVNRDKVRVELRLFLKDRKCMVEVRCLSEWCFDVEAKFAQMSLSLIHTTDPTKPLHLSFHNANAKFPLAMHPITSRKASRIFDVTSVDGLRAFVCNSKVLVNFKM